MKLKELLVQALPEFGGWPGGFGSDIKRFMENNDIEFDFDIECSYFKNQEGEKVTRQEYEAALAASQKVEWDGTGLPPIGIEFEMSYRNNNDWKKCVLIAHGEELIIYKYDGEIEFSGHRSNYQFRPIPIRSEADKKRKQTIDLMDKRFKGSARRWQY